MAILTPEDLDPFATIEPAKAEAMIADAEAMAALAAPCILDEAFLDRPELAAALKALLRRAIVRWHDAGNGAVVQMGAGPFQQTVAQGQNMPRNLFWPSEIEQLRDLCSQFNDVRSEGAFSIDTVPSSGIAGHMPYCDLMFLGATCSCGFALGMAPTP
ncbi:MAG: hypothetical protein ACTHW7_12350 [Actinomycetaceae bacterium]